MRRDKRVSHHTKAQDPSVVQSPKGRSECWEGGVSISRGDATGCAATEIAFKHKVYCGGRPEVGGTGVQQLDGGTVVFDCSDPRTLSSQ